MPRKCSMKSYYWREQKLLNLLGWQRRRLSHNQKESVWHTHFTPAPGLLQPAESLISQRIPLMLPLWLTVNRRVASAMGALPFPTTTQHFVTINIAKRTEIPSAPPKLTKPWWVCVNAGPLTPSSLITPQWHACLDREWQEVHPNDLGVLGLGDLGTCAETIMNAKTARDLSRMTEKWDLCTNGRKLLKLYVLHA